MKQEQHREETRGSVSAPRAPCIQKPSSGRSLAGNSSSENKVRPVLPPGAPHSPAPSRTWVELTPLMGGQALKQGPPLLEFCSTISSQPLSLDPALNGLVLVHTSLSVNESQLRAFFISGDVWLCLQAFPVVPCSGWRVPGTRWVESKDAAEHPRGSGQPHSRE